MSEQTIEKTFDHKKAGVGDKIHLVSELEHIVRHSLRSAASLVGGEESDDSDFSPTKYLIIAKRAKEIRREYMRKHFGDISEYDWCLCKSAACLRQLAYEVCESDAEELREIDDLVDEIWGGALGIDLSDCYSCREDKNAFSGIGERAVEKYLK